MINKQIWQVRYLIPEFYPKASDFYVDEVEGRVYFEDDDSEMQARIVHEDEEVVFQFKQGEDWYFAGSSTFEEVNEINEARIF